MKEHKIKFKKYIHLKMKEFREANEKHNLWANRCSKWDTSLESPSRTYITRIYHQRPIGIALYWKNRKEWLKSILLHLTGMTQFPILWQCSFCFYIKKKKNHRNKVTSTLKREHRYEPGIWPSLRNLSQTFEDSLASRKHHQPWG